MHLFLFKWPKSIPWCKFTIIFLSIANAGHWGHFQVLSIANNVQGNTLYTCVCVCVCVYTHIYIYTFVPVYSVVSLCDPMDHSPPDSSVHGIFQARRVEWVAIFLLQGNFPTQGSNLNTCLYHFHWHQIKLKVPLTVASTSLSLFFFHIFAISNYFNL